MIGGLEERDSEPVFLTKVVAGVLQIFFISCILFWARNQKKWRDIAERYKLVYTHAHPHITCHNDIIIISKCSIVTRDTIISEIAMNAHY